MRTIVTCLMVQKVQFDRLSQSQAEHTLKFIKK